MKRIISLLMSTVLVAAMFSGCGADVKPGTVVDGQIATTPLPETKAEHFLASLQEDQEDYYLSLAEFAVADLLDHFWTGDAKKGYLKPTWNGSVEFDPNEEDWRGSMWETAQAYWSIYDLWVITGDAFYEDRIRGVANFYRSNFTAAEFENAGGHLNWASDDCAWNAMMLLSFYTVTEDEWFMQRAANLLDNAYDRWYRDNLGAMIYKDGVDFMSLYEVGFPLCWLRLWEITGDQKYYDKALKSYEGIHEGLGRPDGIYYCEATEWGGQGNLDDIEEGMSSSFLTGNMAMAALSAKFYRITGEQAYLDRVYTINEGILQHYDDDGVLLNDRDAFTNGAYAAYYAAEVLSLPNTGEMQQLLKATAVSVLTSARTPDGYYGGTWKGPAEGGKSQWYCRGSIPQFGNVTGTSVSMVVAAAVLEAGITEYDR